MADRSYCKGCEDIAGCLPDKVEALEAEIARLKAKIKELEAKNCTVTTPTGPAVFADLNPDHTPEGK